MCDTAKHGNSVALTPHLVTACNQAVVGTFLYFFVIFEYLSVDMFPNEFQGVPLLVFNFSCLISLIENTQFLLKHEFAEYTLPINQRT